MSQNNNNTPLMGNYAFWSTVAIGSASPLWYGTADVSIFHECELCKLVISKDETAVQFSVGPSSPFTYILNTSLIDVEPNIYHFHLKCFMNDLEGVHNILLLDSILQNNKVE